MLVSFFRSPAFSKMKEKLLLERLQKVSSDIQSIETEWRFYVDSEQPLTKDELEDLQWLLRETFEPEGFRPDSNLAEDGKVFEVGPRITIVTPWSSNAVSVCHACGLDAIRRIERARRYRIITKPDTELSGDQQEAIYRLIHDRMTEESYLKPLSSFDTGIVPEPLKIIPLIKEGMAALEKVNRELGLSFDEDDKKLYYNLFVNILRRNPTDVELFQLGQGNSEHSRHWRFKSRHIINGVEMPHTMFELVKMTLKKNPGNSIIGFKDNASAIEGFLIETIMPDPRAPSPFKKELVSYELTLTAETHNFPTGVCPFPGAETGTGGRIRDNEAVGRGALFGTGTTGYMVGNLRIPGYKLPWENEPWLPPSNLATPLEIEIRASDGASDYGNKFGEPVILGTTRSFGMMVGGEPRGWVKPIMFTGGIGQIDQRHVEKGIPYAGLLVVQIGGPAYRIGVGGGSASSMIQGQNVEELDFNAVQRGDAEMEKRMDRFVRACVELGDDSPIVAIHDLGAGGDCNAVPEAIYPAGGKINLRKIPLGDPTLAPFEYWGNESQERLVFLIQPDKLELCQKICKREKILLAVIGKTTGDGRIVVYDEKDGTTPVDLELERILGELPQKTVRFERIPVKLQPLKFSFKLTARAALERVLRLLSVGSKHFLTRKVDRDVTGLIAQQQCVGPLQLTLSNVAVYANSFFSTTGIATSIGEQPIKGLVNIKAMARMSVAEALNNLVWAQISRFKDIKMSANWMWAAKLPGEGARLYDAVQALSELLIGLEIAIDGGKDSLSMAAQAVIDGKKEVVKAPGTLVISAYAPCSDIAKTITPDLKAPGRSKLIFVDLVRGKQRLGGSALAQVYEQVGNECPDIENPQLLRQSFEAIQELISSGLILSGHDRSDGGLITCLLEMAFAGNCGLNLTLQDGKFDPLAYFFNEESGLVIEYLPEHEETIKDILERYGLRGCYRVMGRTTLGKLINISYNSQSVLNEDMRVLRDIWQETSFKLDELQANPESSRAERRNTFDRQGPCSHLSFIPTPTPKIWLSTPDKPKVAVLREEGTNGDREMAGAFWLAGFEPWDVTMTDLIEGRISLRNFRVVAFCGGFSFADVLDAGKGWAGVIKFNDRVREELEKFYAREDTFSFGVCNGSQVMPLLGIVPWSGIETVKQPRFIRNESEIFESRLVSVKILPSRSIFLDGMEGSILSVWVAHAEGRLHCPDEKIYNRIIEENLAPIRFVNDEGEVTCDYPYNPNGSPAGITALCSPDGRHLAMMPHPERLFLPWQWPYWPPEWSGLEASPWIRLFQNARIWCEAKLD